MRLALGRVVMEELLDQLELPLSADERRLQPGRLQLSAHTRDDPQGPPQSNRLRLALQLLLAGALVDDRLLARTSRPLAAQRPARLRRRPNPRGRAHQIARNHPP